MPQNDQKNVAPVPPAFLFRLALGVGIAVLALGLVVIVGWHSRVTALIQIHPDFVPMQYNTALGFLLAGGGLLAVNLDRWRWSVVAGSAIGLIGLLTLLEYALGSDLGIDQLFMQHHITVLTPHPGRMAPNTALCFMLSGTAIILGGSRRPNATRLQAVSLLGTLVTALGIVAFSGYIFGIQTAYGWGHLTRMAVHTSLGFIVLGIGLSAIIWQAGNIARNSLPATVGVATATITVALWQALYALELRTAELVGKQADSLAEEFVLVFGLVMAAALAYAAASVLKAQRAARTAEDARILLHAEMEEHRHAEEASEERYRRLFADSAVVMLVIDPADGCIVDANAAACAYYGYAPAELKAMKILDINTLSPEQVQAEMKRAREHNKSHFDFCHRLASGEVRNVEVSSGPIKVDGRTLLLSVVTDVTERKNAEQEREQLLLKISRSAAEMEAILASQSDVVLLYDTEMNVRRVNPSFFKAYGFDPVGLNVRDIIRLVSCRYLDERPFVLEEQPTPRALRGEEVGNALFKVTRADGATAIVETSSRPMYVGGGIMGTVTVWHDITESKRAEEALRLQSEITANAAEGIALIKADDGIIHYANQRFEMLFGYAPGELAGKHISIINAPTEKTPQETAAEIMGALEKQGVWSGEVLNRKKDDTTLWTSANVSTFQHPELGTLLITYQADISEKKKTEEMIWKQANFDALTGLPNRHMFHDRLVQEIRKANRAGQKLALMFIDLDRFKEVNDTLGHDMGDVLLVEAAHRIGDCVRATDMVARMGGDEFTVTLTDIMDISSIERVAQNILQKLSEPFRLKTEIAYVSASIGITLYPDDATGMEELLKNADQTMYVAKGLGRNCHSYFTHELQAAAQARLRLINDLRGALAANQFRVHFQPIVDMATGAIHKAEALIRWQHPERGLVSPAEFIPLAEETGLIFEIGDWVFHESARWVKRWRELHHPGFQVSVNKSPVQFYKLGDKDSAWLAHLRALDLPGKSIVIEITEGLLLGAEPAIGDALFTLRDAGIQIAIDDFGTGYSSLSYLNRFHIDYLKIDQSFTRNLTPESSDMALSEAIIVMAHKLDLKVIAEGVETEMQCDLLAAAGCDYAQGYLYSRPMPPEEFEELLLTRIAHSSSLP